MKNVIFLIPFYRVQKLELPEIVTGVLAIIEKYDPKALFVEGMFNLLQAQKPNLQKLSAINSTKALTSGLVSLSEQRDRVVRSVLKKADSIKTLSLYVTQSSIIFPVVENYLMVLKNENSKAKS